MTTPGATPVRAWSRARISAQDRLRVLGQQQDRRVAALHVGGIDAGIRQHIAAAVRDDQHALAVAHDLGRFAQDHLDEARVLVHLLGEMIGAGGRPDGREVDEAALCLRDDLLRDDEDVARPQRQAGGAQARAR